MGTEQKSQEESDRRRGPEVSSDINDEGQKWHEDL